MKSTPPSPTSVIASNMTIQKSYSSHSMASAGSRNASDLNSIPEESFDDCGFDAIMSARSIDTMDSKLADLELIDSHVQVMKSDLSICSTRSDGMDLRHATALPSSETRDDGLHSLSESITISSDSTMMRNNSSFPHTREPPNQLESGLQALEDLQYDVAVEQFQVFVQDLESQQNPASKDPSSLADGYQYLGLALFNGERREEALQCFRRCFRLRLIHQLDMTTIKSLMDSTLSTLGSSGTVGKFTRTIESSILHERKGDQLLSSGTPLLAIPEFRTALHLEELNKKTIAFKETALHGSIDEANIRCKLACAYVMAQEAPKGFMEFRTALRIYTNHSVVKLEASETRCMDGIRAAAHQMGYTNQNSNDVQSYLDAVSMALVQEWMGDECCRESNFEDASQHYGYAIKLEEIGIGQKQLGLASLHTKAATLYEAMEDFQQAMSYHCHALAVYEPSLGSAHRNTRLTKRKIKSLMLQLRTNAAINQ